VIGGTLTLIPSGTPSKLLRGVDFRPCTGKRHLNQSLAGGYFESPEGRLDARGTFSFRRDATRSVRFGNLVLMLDGTVGHVLATIAPTNGALNLFDATGVRYGNEVASGRLFLTAGGARLLNRLLGLRGFAGGMSCGRFSLHAHVVTAPAPPPKPPGTTSGGTTPPTTTTPTTTTPTVPPGSTLTVTISPSDGGSVKSSRAGIACPTECTFTFAPGEQVTLTANAHGDNGYRFDRWDGSCGGTSTTCTIFMDQSRTVVAKFVKK
jgi:hypothetical protein